MSLPAPKTDRTVVVTGASSGIGSALAREFAARGHHVTLVARRADKLEALAAEIAGSGGQTTVVPADLSDRVARASLAERVAALGLKVDILVNNAGLATLGPVAAAVRGDEMHMIEVDVMAVVDLCVQFLPGMIDRGRGAVLNVASAGAFQPLPGQAGYGACKAFVLSYTQSLHGELAGTGVTATLLCPGPVDTGFGQAAGISKQDAEAELPAIMWVSPEKVARTGVDALADGNMVTVPGLANKVATVLGSLVPNRLLVPMLAKRHPGLRG